MNAYESIMMRELRAGELDQVSGGSGFHVPVSGGPVPTEPKITPIIIVSGSGKPTGGPVVLLPTPVTFSIP